MDETRYESKLTEKQLPLMKLELIIDELTNTLSKVKKDSLEGVVSRSYPTLKEQYMNVLERTCEIDDSGEYDIKPWDNQECLLVKIRSYIKLLKQKNIYSLGTEDLRI